MIFFVNFQRSLACFYHFYVSFITWFLSYCQVPNYVSYIFFFIIFLCFACFLFTLTLPFFRFIFQFPLKRSIVQDFQVARKYTGTKTWSDLQTLNYTVPIWYFAKSFLLKVWITKMISFLSQFPAFLCNSWPKTFQFSQMTLDRFIWTFVIQNDL